MDNKGLNQEEFLKILMYAHDIGENSNDVTTKEMLDNLIAHIRNGLVS
ncbi:hypothetical protein V2J31_12140 [Bacillus safensis]|nr:hypothetical protein [Bacillus safensis]